MDEAEVTSGVCTEFRYLMVRLGRQLHQEDCEGLMYVHKVPNKGDKADVGLHILSRMEEEGYFEPLHPEKLQEILSKIGRKDLTHDIKEYKQSSMYKRAVKLEQEREKENKKKAKKKNKDGNEKGVGDERRVAARLLSGVEVGTPPQERRWRDMFAMALTQTAQLVEQMNLLRKTIEDHDEEEETYRRIQETLASLMKAQDEVDTLSKTLKKAISAAGLKSRQTSQEDLLDSPDTEEPKSTKKAMLPSTQQSPRLTRANTHDGISKIVFPKAISAPTQPTKSPLSTLSLTAAPASTPSTTATTAPPPPPIATIPVHIPAPLASSNANKAKVDSSAAPAPTSPSNRDKSKATPSADSAPTSSSNANRSKATPSAAAVPTTGPSNANKIPPAVKTKPVTKTPEFNRKLESLIAEGASNTSTSSTIVTKSALAHANSANLGSKLTRSHTLPKASKMIKSLPKTTPTTAPEEGKEPEHVYDDPNLSKEETEDMYMNSSMVVAVVGSTTQIGGVAGSTAQQAGKDKGHGMQKQESQLSIQEDSGFEQEDDKTWPHRHHYQNITILTTEEYAKPDTTSTTGAVPATGQYTKPNTNR